MARAMARRLRYGALTLALGAGGACAAGSGARLPPAASPAALPCREVVDADGRVMARTVDWHAAPNEADRARLDAACRTVGPVVIAGPASPQRSPAFPARPRDLVVVTWNLYAGGGDVRALVEAVIRARGAGASADYVLLLQDVHRAGSMVPAVIPPGAPVPRAVRPDVPWREGIVSVARAIGWHLVYVPSMRNGAAPGPAGPEDRGTAILSTVPLDEIAVIELPLARHRRAAVAATLVGRGDERPRVRVASVHLDTVDGWRRLYLFSSQHRARQADHVIDALGDDQPMVVGADLNTWAEGPAEPAVARLRRAFDDTPPPAWQPTFQGLWRLDYLFFRLPEGWTARGRRLDRTFGSDHHPLVAEISAGR